MLAVKVNKVTFKDNGEVYATIYVKDKEDYYQGRNKFLTNFLSEDALNYFNEGLQMPELNNFGYREVSIKIKEDLCKGCTKCARTCPVGAIEGTVKNPHKINQEKCIKCEACLNNCPFKAIVKE